MTTTVLHRPRLLICALGLVALLPLVNKPVNMDDPLFLWTARQIIHHPLDPFGFDVNWGGFSRPMHEETKNPPLTCYFLALVGSIFGFSEPAMHAAMIPWALLMLYATSCMARRCGASDGRATLAAILVLISPGFLVSAGTLMCDVMMAALWTSALALWMWAIERDRPGMFFAAGAIAGAAALTKYPAINLLPLLAAYAILSRRRVAMQFAALCVPVALLITYELLMRHLYGHGLIASASSFATAQNEGAAASGRFANLLAMLAFAGGATLGPAVAMLCAQRVRGRLIAAGGFAVTLLVIHLASTPAQMASGGTISIQWAGMAVLGAMIIVLALMQAVRSGREPTAWLLCLWIGGVCVFAGFFNWSINARSLLPMAPAAAVIAVKQVRLDTLHRKLTVAGMIVCAVITAGTAIADYRLASANRAAAMIVRERAGDARVWFTGHWGFQWYMQAFASPIDSTAVRLVPGDLVVMNLKTSDPKALPAAAVRQIDQIDLPAQSAISVMSAAGGAGFYSSAFGPLPWAFATAPPERIAVFQVQAPIRSAAAPATTSPPR